MSDREIMDAKNGIVARKSYGFRDEVVKNVQILVMKNMAKHYTTKEHLKLKT